MNVYLVGGAVRDNLLALPVKDKDFVVVGSSVQTMLDNGFTQVGKDFPVFLHPKTQQEYALARTERKTGPGYQGFSCHANENVTLEQDLLRRDLTINAIAQGDDGQLVDPYGGVDDLNNRILRHVSSAFSEDPLRVLRVARFAARFHPQGFTIATDTLRLMQHMVASGELCALTPERVWQEIDKVLDCQTPQVFFEVLRQCGALKVILPELDALFGVPQPEKWHPEIDTGIHTLMVLAQACLLTDDKAIRFAALTHDLGKALTPAEQWPKHHGHGQKGVKPIKQLCKRLRVPNEARDLAILLSEQHQNIHNAFELRPETVLNIFDKADFWRKPQHLEGLLIGCHADTRGRTGFEQQNYPQAAYLKACFTAANNIKVKPIIEAGFSGAQIKQQLALQRIEAISQLKEATLNHDI
ncbi:multifunctional CCA addition/repair protein [Shewanella intestini]|uniref:Multifunctional CCA protein n=1 Tax=Shewanella intestini TaxID=2017544 RepID=A0ABS5HZS4_9GAMM|nr:MULTISPECIES: multifunctional CCA addition/repair protein [Shewanella]MBR9726610.1 multifunctional CCA addition/repair protein [Shewanella intestini]MRG34824.1 multifunctional CCA addition/repair protein [Shewanella sp. XMDDZSB0408]